jgi:hypothetical protein
MPFSLVNGAPPNQTPPLDARGRFTAPWYAYLVSLQKANSGVTVGLGGLDLNGQTITGSAAFTGPINFALAPTFTNAAGTRTNLGLGSAATQPISAFDAAGAAAAVLASSLQKSANLSDLANAATARTNLGLGSAALQATTAFDAAGAATAAQAAAIAASLQRASNLSDLANAATARGTLGAAGLAVSNTFTAAQNISTTAAISLTITGNLNTGFGGLALLADGLPVLNARTYGSTATTVLGGITLAGWSVLYHNSGNGLLIETANAAPLVFGTSNAERARLVSAGRLLLGTTTDDGSNLLQVNGAATVAGLTLTTPASLTIGSGWLSWTPTITGWSLMTISGLTINDAQYIRLGPFVFFKLWFQCTLGGTASNQIFVSVPVNLAGILSFIPCTIKQSGGYSPAWMYVDPSGQLIKVLLPNEVNFALGAVYVLASGFYRCT